MQIEVISKPGCRQCVTAKALLSRNNIDFSEKQIPEDISLELVKQTYPDAQSLPIIVVDGRNVGNVQNVFKYVI